MTGFKRKTSPYRIGTSGYSYSWNKGKPDPFRWYLAQGFNSVEINASFYRFPSASWIKRWTKFSPPRFDFTIKVHRSITHYLKLKGERSVELFSRFARPLLEDRKMNSLTALFLFQMPAEFGPSKENIDTVAAFFKKSQVSERSVIEFRDKRWWLHTQLCAGLGLGFCSVDAPALPREIIQMNGLVYLRLHGREKWYSSIYSEQQLAEVCNELERSASNARRGVYVYLNNDHGMLPNGAYLMNRLGISPRKKDGEILAG